MAWCGAGGGVQAGRRCALGNCDQIQDLGPIMVLLTSIKRFMFHPISIVQVSVTPEYLRIIPGLGTV